MDISREERLFCAHLYFGIKEREKEFVKWLNKSISVGLDENAEWEAGYEVCFYRDYLFEKGKPVKDTEYSAKRTFDICLFSEGAIVIIEAKAFQGFDNKQMVNFEKDKEMISRIIEKRPGADFPKVILIGLISSRYSPKTETVGRFDGIINWKQLSGSGLIENISMLERADDIFRKTK